MNWFKSTLFGFILCFGVNSRAQELVFNSVQTAEKQVDKLLLISNYYTLTNNLDNPKSSVFVSKKPTINQVEENAIELESDFFILTKDQKLLAMILFSNYPKPPIFTVIYPRSKVKQDFNCSLSGDITENRALELMRLYPDSSVKIVDSIFYFNNKELKIISNASIEQAVLELMEKQKIRKKKASNLTVLSQSEVTNYVLTESKPGGRMDFMTAIQGKEFESVQIKTGIFTTNLALALYRWGSACFDIGVRSPEDAFALYAKIIGRTLNQRELEYIRMGFDKMLEKK